MRQIQGDERVHTIYGATIGQMIVEYVYAGSDTRSACATLFYLAEHTISFEKSA